MIGLPERKGFLLRIEPQVLDALRRWADDEFRSVNAQIDVVLRRALKDAGRWKNPSEEPRPPNARPETERER